MRYFVVSETAQDASTSQSVAQESRRFIIILTEGEAKQLLDPDAGPVYQMVTLSGQRGRMEIYVDDEMASPSEIPSLKPSIIKGRKSKKR